MLTCTSSSYTPFDISFGELHFLIADTWVQPIPWCPLWQEDYGPAPTSQWVLSLPGRVLLRSKHSIPWCPPTVNPSSVELYTCTFILLPTLTWTQNWVFLLQALENTFKGTVQEKESLLPRVWAFSLRCFLPMWGGSITALHFLNPFHQLQILVLSLLCGTDYSVLGTTGDLWGSMVHLSIWMLLVEDHLCNAHVLL
jgi:hypothetical protein